MKKQLFWGLVFMVLFSACRQTALREELQTTRAALSAAMARLDSIQSLLANPKAGPANSALVHIVFFKLKPDADPLSLIDELKKMEAIEQITSLKIGTFQNLGDPRALSDYGLLMEMAFASETAYQAYQQHPIHLAVKASIQPSLAGPPATYDYWVK